MTDNELKKLNRRDLLELLLLQQRENERLQERIRDLTEQLNDRSVQIEGTGSLAEASLVLNKVFEDADKAAAMYLENVTRRCDEREAAANEFYRTTTAKAEEILREAEETRDRKLGEVNEKQGILCQCMDSLFESYPELKATYAAMTQQQE